MAILAAGQDHHSGSLAVLPAKVNGGWSRLATRGRCGPPQLLINDVTGKVELVTG